MCFLSQTIKKNAFQMMVDETFRNRSNCTGSKITIKSNRDVKFLGKNIMGDLLALRMQTFHYHFCLE